MKKILTLLVLLSSSIFSLHAQYPCVHYSFSEHKGTFTQFNNGAKDVFSYYWNAGQTSATSSINYKLPFRFNYAGVEYDSIHISPYGWLAFYNTLPTTLNSTIPSIDGTPTQVIAPFWSYLQIERPKTEIFASVYEGVVEENGDQIWVIQYSNVWWMNTEMEHGSYADTLINFQVRLYKNSGIIEFVYGEMGAPNNNTPYQARPACIGINTRYSNDLTQFISITPNASGASSSTTTANNDIISNAGLDTGTVYRFTPPPCVPPGYPMVSEITPFSAKITWNGNAAHTYNVFYTKTTDTNWANVQTASATGTNVTLDNLNFYTTYKVRVENVSNCSGKPSAITEFATTVDIPWSDGFENIGRNFPLPPNVKITGKRSDKKFLAYPNAPGKFNRTPKSGNAVGAFFTESDSIPLAAYNYGVDNWLFTPQFKLRANAKYRFSFWYVTDGIDGWKKLEVKAGTAQDSNKMTIDLGNPVLNPHNITYQEYYSYFSFPKDTILHIGIHCVADANPFFLTIDDMALEEVFTPCTADIHDLKVTDKTLSTIALAWDSLTPKYNLQYKLKEDIDYWGNTSNIEVNNQTHFTIQDLLPDTAYIIRVRAVCANGEKGRWFQTKTSTISKNMVLPYLQQFDNTYDLADYAKQWSKITEYGRRATIGLNYEFIASSPNSLELFNGNLGGYSTVLVSAPIDGMEETMSDLQTRFRAKSNTPGLNLLIGIMTDPADVRTFYPCDTVRLTKDFAAYKADLKKFPTTVTSKTFYIAYLLSEKGRGSNYRVYMDDIYIERIPTCPTAPNTPIVVGSTPESMVFGIHSSEQEFEYSYRELGSSAWSVPVVSADTLLEIGGLEETKVFETRVRYYCNYDNMQKTSWSFPVRNATLCTAPSLPYHDGFEYLSYENEMPKCMNFSAWTSVYTGAFSSLANVMSAPGDPNIKYRKGYNDHYYLYFGRGATSYAKPTGSWMFSPSFYLKADSLYRFSFWYLGDGNGKRDSLEVKAGRYQNAAAMTIDFGNVLTGLGDTVYKKCFVDFTPAQTDYYTFGIHHVYGSTKSESFCIDELELKASPNCKEPVVQLNGGLSSPTEIPLSFSADGAANFILDYWQGGVQQPRINVSGNTYTLTGLLPDSTYTIRVKTNCSEEFQSEHADDFIAKTLNHPITTLPWKENFASITKAGELPKDMVASSFGAKVNTDTRSLGSVRDSYRPDTSYKEYNYAYFAAGANDWIFSPNFKLLKNNTYRFSFMYRGDNSTWDSLEVMAGNMQSPEGMSIKLGNPLSKFNTNHYKKFYVDFKPEKDSTYFFGIHAVAGSGAYYLSIDKLGLEVSPSCPGLCNIGIGTVGNTSIELALSNLGTDFEIRYADVSDIANWKTLNAANYTGSYLLSNLKASSQYLITARQICAGNTFSQWSDTLLIGTQCRPLSISEIPFTQNFDYVQKLPTLPHCWSSFVNCGQGAAIGITGSAAYSYSQPNSIQFFSNNACGVQKNYPTLISPQIDRSLDLKKLRTTFQARTVGKAALVKVGFITNPANPVDFYVMDSVRVTSEWDYHTISFGKYTHNIADSLPVYIAYRLAEMNIQAFIDDILIDSAASCADIFNFNQLYAADKTLKIGWNAEADSFQVAYKKTTESETAWQYAKAIGKIFTVTGLASNTQYDLKVRAQCTTNEYGRWSNTRKMRTNYTYLDSVSLPLFEDLDTVKTPNLPFAWRSIGNVSSLSKNRGAKVYSDTNSVFLNNQGIKNTIMVSPPININYINKMRTRLMVCAGGSYKLNIGLMKDPADPATFVFVKQISLNTGWNLCNVAFDNFTGFAGGSDVAYIAYMHGDTITGISQHSIHLDDIFIEKIPTCPDLNGLKTSNILASSLNLTWDAEGGTDFMVRYKKENEKLFSDSIRVAGSSCALNSLQANTNYIISVKRICSESNQGAWSMNISARMLCSTNLPYQSAFNANADCWQMKEGRLTASATTLTDANSWARKHYLNISRDSLSMQAAIEEANCFKWLISPQIIAGSVDSVAIDIDFGLTRFNVHDAPDTTGKDDRFVILVSSDLNFTNDSAVRIYNNQGSPYVFNNIDPTGQHARITVKNNGSPFFVALYAESTVKNARNDLFIKQFSVSEAVPCPAVSRLDTSHVTPYQATLSWDKLTANTWELYYGLKGKSINNMRKVNIYNYPVYELEELELSTEYDVYIRAICGEEYIAPLSEKFTFKTARIFLCKTVTTFGVNNIAYTNATAYWDKGESSQWEVEYSELDSAVNKSTIVLNQPIFQLNNLTAATKYKVRVRSICSVADTSGWSSYAEFTTQQLAPCDSAYNLRCASVEKQNNGLMKANIKWESIRPDRWVIEYGEHNFSFGSGTKDTARVKSYTIPNLHEDKIYDLYVTSLCRNEWSKTVVISFTAKPFAIDKNLIAEGSINIAPNPAREYATITIVQLKGNVDLQILNLKGEVLHSEVITVTESPTKHRISLQAFPKGIYTLRFKHNDQYGIEKLIVQ